MDCEDWELELEFEIDDIAEELISKTQTACPKCGRLVFGKKCPRCGAKVNVEKFYDPDFEEYEKQMEKEYDESMKKENWREVKESDLA